VHFRLLADLVVVVHLAFVLLVVFGGLLVLRWPRLALIQLPAAVWGVVIEWAGWICPLTPLENSLRARGGAAGYGGGFVEHYLLRVLYPAGLTRNVQIVLGLTVLLVNAIAYGLLLARRRRADDRH
jgi:Protein of Unknown function (DUF2784)